MKLWGKGVTQRRTVMGSELAGSIRTRARTRQFILSRIDARHGACGLVPRHLDGALVTNDFPVFTINLSRASPEYLQWYSKTPAFIDLCLGASEGTTNRVRLKEDRFLASAIPLPPLEDQRRIVAHLDQVAARTTDATTLHADIGEEATLFLQALLRQGFSAASETVPMSSFLSLRQPDVVVDATRSYDFAGVYSFGRGLFRSGVRSGTEISYPRLTTLHAGNVVYPKLMAWEGAFAIVQPDFDGLVVSTEFPVFAVDQDRVLTEVLGAYLSAPTTWPGLAGASTGTNVRRRRLQPADFLAHQFPIPPRANQLLIQKSAMLFSKLSHLGSSAVADLRALATAACSSAFLA